MPDLPSTSRGSALSPEAAHGAPPGYVAAPDSDHSLRTRKFQGIPSLAIGSSGRLWATWYAGCTPNEDHNNYVVLSSSRDDGATWTEMLVVDPDGPGPARAFDPQVWFDPLGRLWLIWAQSVGHDGLKAGVWAIVSETSDAERPQWTRPRRLTDGVMMGKPFLLSSGEWVLPASTWRTTDFSAKLVVSTDNGASWSVRGGCNVPAADRAFDEHMIVERDNGSLWLLARTGYGIGESLSRDRGATWPTLTPSTIQHPSARFFVWRLKSGNLLLVKHGAIAVKTERSHLMAFLSKDEGLTWQGGLLLDERLGVSYPDGQQGTDGVIRIIYDYSRTGCGAILMTKFREEDIVPGQSAAPGVVLRMGVSAFCTT